MTRSDRTRARNATILLGSTLVVLAGTVLAPGLPEMAVAFQDVPNAEFLVRLTLTIPALFIALGAPLAGFLLDRWGRKRTLIASLILYSVAGPAGFVLDSLFAILVSRAVLGLAIAGVAGGFTTLIADYFTGSRRNQFFGYQAAALGLVGMFSLLIGGFLSEIDWRIPFLIHFVAVPVLFGVLLTVEEPKIRADSRSEVVSDEKATFPLGGVARVYAIAFVAMLLFFVMPVLAPFFLTATIGLSPGQVGIALALPALVGVIVALQFRRLKARLSFMSIFAIVFLALAANHFVLAFTPLLGLVLVGLLIGGLALGLVPPAVNVWISSIAPPAHRGRAISGLTAALFLGQFFTPFITEPLLQQVGVTGTFGIIGGVALFLVVVFIVAALRGRLARPSSSRV
ncbi:MAG: MFS transporter [Thermoplasmata archaeon]